MVRFSVAPREVLLAATTGAAQLLGFGKATGTIVAGKTANIAAASAS